LGRQSPRRGHGHPPRAQDRAVRADAHGASAVRQPRREPSAVDRRGPCRIEGAAMKGVAAALAGLLLWATPAAAQSAPAPLITVRLGAVTTDEVCQLSRQSSTIGPTVGASSILLTSRDLCRRPKPTRGTRAQR